jgi:hypothetical protein
MITEITYDKETKNNSLRNCSYRSSNMFATGPEVAQVWSQAANAQELIIKDTPMFF